MYLYEWLIYTCLEGSYTTMVLSLNRVEKESCVYIYVLNEAVHKILDKKKTILSYLHKKFIYFFYINIIEKKNEKLGIDIFLNKN